MLLRQGSFWSVRDRNGGSWMWRKLLKHRDLAKSFHKVAVHNGLSTSLWHENWSELGTLKPLVGSLGTIDMGIPENSTAAMVLSSKRRRRRHRVAVFNQIGDEIARLSRERSKGNDIHLWRYDANTFKTNFVTQTTWNQIRQVREVYARVWFKHATPKFAYFTWLATLNRLSTGDRLRKWNVGQTNCPLCVGFEETRNHLFFECRYSSEVWRALTQQLLGSSYSTKWADLTNLIGNPKRGPTQNFLIRYVFQATLYILWKERNGRKHGEHSNTITSLVKQIDKTVWNRLSSIQNKGDGKLHNALMVWFEARS